MHSSLSCSRTSPLSKRKPSPGSSHSPFPTPLPLVTANLLSLPIDLPISGHFISVESDDMGHFGRRSLAYFSERTVLRFIHAVACIGISFLFCSCIISHCMDIPHSVYPVTRWWTFGLFLFLAVVNSAVLGTL